MKKLYLLIFLSVSLFFLAFTNNNNPKISDETEACIGCHQSITPGIYHDWLDGVHSKMNLASALQKQKINRKISIEKAPANINEDVAIGCYECHSLNAENHKDNFEHFGYRINIVVSPNDCKTCHPVEADQYTKSKKAFALDNLKKNVIYHSLVDMITSPKEFTNNKLIPLSSDDNSKNETCYACHGTEVNVNGTRKVQSNLGEAEIPVLTNWPNQGVGRVNPDNSKGACTVCHPRHSFSIEIARQPYTCGQCHLEPDVPAYNVYKESKHGNIFDTKKSKWNWSNVPWTIGKDFTAPSCATCHNSLTVDESGEVVAERTHDFGSRIWQRLFGLIYSTPQPKTGFTYEIKNKDGLPLPAAFDGTLAKEYLIDNNEQAVRKEKMTRICSSCHSTNWITGHFDKLDKTVIESNKMTKTATDIMLEAWKVKVNDKASPFDESLEQKWIKQWLFYANSLRYASAMCGPDYASFKNGWWELTANLRSMKTELDLLKKK